MKRVVVVGGGISGLCAAYLLKSRGFEVSLLEASHRVGGKAWTLREDGFVCEEGPNGFLDNRPETLRFIADIGLSQSLLRASKAAKDRFIVRKSRLISLPDNPKAFLSSPVLPCYAKLRLMLEFFIKAKKDDEDETVADFARRRLGKQALDYLIEPLVSGVFAGDATKLSLRSAFPRIYELENTYGGLFRALLALRKQGKAKGAVGAPSGQLTSFFGGMRTLVEHLENLLKDSIILGARVHGIELKGKEYLVFYSKDGKDGCIEAPIVILSCPSYVSATLISSLSSRLSKAMNQIPYAPIVVVGLGFPLSHFKKPPKGFGFLAPMVEKRPVLGCLFDSSIFDDRAREGDCLVRFMVGGARSSDMAQKDDRAIVESCIAELDTFLGLRGEPRFVRVIRHEQGIPQYNKGHGQILGTIEEEMSRFQGLYICNNAYYGVGINDCISRANMVANKIFKEFYL
jgi:oxygen-dependent protoporphyrinogen oxidase